MKAIELKKALGVLDAEELEREVVVHCICHPQFRLTDLSIQDGLSEKPAAIVLNAVVMPFVRSNDGK